MNIKKLVSAASALTIAVSAFAGLAVTANAADENIIYSNDFSVSTLDDAISWTAGAKKPSGYNYAQIGRTGAFSLDDGKLYWTTSGGKASATVSHASFGFFDSRIKEATAENDYTISFDWTVNTTHTAGNTAMEIINANKNVVLGLNLNHTRKNSTTGANTVNYYVGGSNGFKVCEDSVTTATNAEGYLGTAAKNKFFEESSTTADLTFNVTLTVSTSGIGTLTIKDSSNKAVVDTQTVSVDAGAGIDAIYFTGLSYNQGNVSNMHLDNFSIEKTVVENDNATTYTVKFVDEAGNELKDSETRAAIIGDATEVTDTDKTPFVTNNKKYIYKSDDSDGKTVEAGGVTEVTIIFREATTYNYNINIKAGDNEAELLTSGHDFEGNTATVKYPRYVIKNNIAYLKSAINNQYNYSFTVNENNQSETLVYNRSTAEGAVAVYYAEGEDVLNDVTVSNAEIRCSMGKGGDVASVATTTIVTLPAGKYKITTAVWGGGKDDSNQDTYSFTAGEALNYTITTTGSWLEGKSDEFTLDKRTDLKVIKSIDGSSAACIDFILIEKTGAYTVPATNIGAFTGAGGSVATAFTAALGDVTGTLSFSVTSGETTKKLTGTTNVESANVVLGIIVTGLNDASATGVLTVE